MKLLILAQTPPPAHGQSLAVEALIAFLRAQPGWDVRHVEFRLSESNADIGRWRIGKPLAVVGACLRVLGTFLRHGRMPLYYVPAPAKRGALYRDWVVMLLCRPFARGVILHWHAVGLGAWLTESATPPERWISRWLLGGVTLSIAQAEIARRDCDLLAPRRSVVVRNGVPDPAPDFHRRAALSRPCAVIFAALGCAEKGLFDTVDGVLLANAAEPGAFRLTAMGPFATPADEAEFHRLVKAAGDAGAAIRHLGFVSREERDRLLREADVYCFPSYYPHEGQPAALLEALAADLPVVTTRWRGIPELLPATHIYFVAPRSPAEIAAQLQAARDAGPAGGTLRAHYLRHFTREAHQRAVLEALTTTFAASPNRP